MHKDNDKIQVKLWCLTTNTTDVDDLGGEWCYTKILMEGKVLRRKDSQKKFSHGRKDLDANLFPAFALSDTPPQGAGGGKMSTTVSSFSYGHWTVFQRVGYV